MSRKGGIVCAYRGCSSKTGEKISLFSFPKDYLRVELWLKACNREDLFTKTVDVLHRNYRLCEKHFEAKYISKGGGLRKHLFQRAVPTIFPHLLRHGGHSTLENDKFRRPIGTDIPAIHIKKEEIDINFTESEQWHLNEYNKLGLKGNDNYVKCRIKDEPGLDGTHTDETEDKDEYLGVFVKEEETTGTRS